MYTFMKCLINRVNEEAVEFKKEITKVMRKAITRTEVIKTLVSNFSEEEINAIKNEAINYKKHLK